MVGAGWVEARAAFRFGFSLGQLENAGETPFLGPPYKGEGIRFLASRRAAPHSRAIQPEIV
jgi:hypothetical protein